MIRSVACKAKVMVLALLTFAVGQASAEQPLWEGTWTHDQERQCTVPESDGAPLVVASSMPKPGLYWQYSAEGGEESPVGEFGQIEFLRAADPYVCYIMKITSIVSLPGWIFDVQCGGEGEIWETRHVLLSGNEGDQLAHYDGMSTSILYRCTLDADRPFGTNDKYGGNINATNGRGYLFLDSREAVGDRQGAYRVSTLYRDATGASRSDSIVSCDPTYGDTGVVDLESGEIYLVEPDIAPRAFSPELANFDLWWMACRDRLHPSSPVPDWNPAIAATLAPIDPSD